MPVHILDAMAREGFEEFLAVNDRRSGLRAFLGIHDTSAGPAFGGIRRWVYRDERQALLDCLRLSRAMTRKCALAGLPAGGAKIVILDRPDMDREAAYRHLGGVVENLGGRFYTGPDVGTGPLEMGWVAEHTRFATHPGPEGPGDLAGATAEGVHAGIAAALCHLDGEEDWPNRRIVIQGLGGVGARLARRLVREGATVVGAEVDPRVAREVALELDIELVDPAREFSMECDVFSPNALGGILHDVTVQKLKCRIVAGGANNVLAKALHGDQLHRRGVLYMPDFVINSGALIRGAIFHLAGVREPVGDIETRIGRAAERVLELSGESGEPPARVAAREADRILDERRLQAGTPELLET